MPDLPHVKGLENLLVTLKALPPEVVSKGGGPVRSSLRAAGLVIKKQYIENVQLIIDQPNKDGSTPQNSKTLEKAIILSRGKPAPGRKGEIYRVRVKRGARAPNGQTANKYGGVLEFGYEGVAAKAPMRRAFDAKKQEAYGVFVTQMQKRLKSAVRKARKLGLL